MGEPVRIVLTVEDQQALAGLQQVNAGINQLGATGAANFKQLAEGAKQASTHIAGMSYYARSGIDSIRFALAGGGARAGFYAIDEAIRGVLASGMGLSTLVPVLGVLAAAVGGGYLVWREYTSSEREAEQAAKDLKTQLEGQVKLVTQLKDLQKAGLLSPQAIQRNLDYLSGKIPLYKDPSTGQITTSPTRTEQRSPADFTFGAPLGGTGGATEVIANQKATALEIQKFIQDNLTVQGKLDDLSIEAANKLKDLREEIHTKSLTEAEQEKQKIHEKYQAERDEIDKLAAAMGVLLTPEKQRENEAAKALSLQDEVREKAAIDFKVREEDEKKADEAAAKSKQYYAQIVSQENADLEHQLAADAAASGKSREQNYQHEYEMRIRLLTQQLYAGEIDEKQYTEAFLEASTKRQVGMTQEMRVARELGQEMQRIAQAQSRQSLEQISSNPFLKDNDRQAALKVLIDQTQQLLAQNVAEQMKTTNTERLLELEREELTLQNELGSLERQQAEDERQINAQRVAGVRQMFANMGQAAKAFGSEGVAVYKGFAIAQATIDTAKAAIGAYSSVVGIPYVGPILAPIAAAAAVAAGAAQIAEIESASAREHGGDVSAGSLYMTGERGRELFAPDTPGTIFNADDTSRLLQFARSGGASSATPAQPRIHVNLFNDMGAVTKHIRDNPDARHVVVDIMRANAHHVQAA